MTSETGPSDTPRGPAPADRPPIRWTRQTPYLRVVRLSDAVMMILGATIGTGIYRNPAVVAMRAGGPGTALLAWVMGGLVTLGVALCCAELGARFPHAGGNYVYLREGSGRLAAFLQGWMILALAGSSAVAGVATMCAEHLGRLCGVSGNAVPVMGATLIAMLSAVNAVGVRPGATVQNLLTLLKVAILLAVISAGFLGGSHSSHVAVATVAPLHWWGGLLGAVGPVLWAYGGWQTVTYIAAEIEDAPSQLPRALALGTITTLVLYLAANVAYTFSLGFAGLAASQTPAVDVMRAAVGTAGEQVILVGIVISTLGVLNVLILAQPRIYQAMAADGLFFATFRRLHPRWHTPLNAILLQAVWSILLCLTGSFEQLVDYTVFGDWIFMAWTMVAFIRLRRRDPAEGAGRYRAPAFPLLPILNIVVALAIVSSTVAAAPRSAGVGACLIAAGLPVYWIWASRRRDS